MLIQQRATHREMFKQDILKLFKTSMVSMDECVLHAIDQNKNRILVEDKEVHQYVVMDLGIEHRGNDNYYLMSHDLIRRFSTMSYQAELGDERVETEFPPPRVTEDLLKYVDVVSSALEQQYYQEEWVHTIRAVDPENKKILWDDPQLGKIIESSFVLSEDGSIIIYGMPLVYWDLEKPVNF